MRAAREEELCAARALREELGELRRRALEEDHAQAAAAVRPRRWIRKISLHGGSENGNRK